jgi:DNA ligase-1
VTRALKAIPNHYIRKQLEDNAYTLEGFDGELVVGDPTAPDCFNVTSSAVMSFEGAPNFKFMVFDKVALGTWRNRWLDGEMCNLNADPHFVEFVCQEAVYNMDDVDGAERLYLIQGYEGVMLRDPAGVFKYGRSTMNEQYLMKLKRFEDFEAEVVGFEEKLHNDNELETDNLGHAKRSSKAAGMVPAGVLGALICRAEGYNDTFNVGSGFDDNLKKEIWGNQAKYLGKLAKIKHQPSGAKDKPRFPTFIGWRDKIDL